MTRHTGRCAVADGYTHIEMDLVAVRDEDVKAVQRAFIQIRDRYSRGGSSFGTSRTSDQAFIREGVRHEYP